MASLETTYMGLKLKSPIIIASSSLTETVESLKKCEANGAGAVVLKSLFEEQIEAEVAKQLEANEEFVNFSQAPGEFSRNVEDYLLSNYISLLKEAKKALSIPVIASICCKTNENWESYAKKMVAAGADGIELNYYPVTDDASVTSKDLDKAFEKFVKFARETVSCPLSIKMGSKFTDMAHKIKFLDDKGIDGVVLFNRSFRPNININTMKISNGSSFSAGTEYTNSLRWTALMAGEVKMDICANTGIHDGETVIKMLLAGAKAVEVCTTVLKNGYEVIGKMNEEVAQWMDKQNLASIPAFCGKLAQEKNAEGYLWERTQFLNLVGGKN